MPRVTKDNPITNYVSREELKCIREGIEASARNRGSKHTNPYLVPEVRAMLIEIAEHRGRFKADSWYDALMNW